METKQTTKMYLQVNVLLVERLSALGNVWVLILKEVDAQLQVEVLLLQRLHPFFVLLYTKSFRPDDGVQGLVHRSEV